MKLTVTEENIDQLSIVYVTQDSPILMGPEYRYCVCPRWDVAKGDDVLIGNNMYHVEDTLELFRSDFKTVKFLLGNRDKVQLDLITGAIQKLNYEGITDDESNTSD